MISPEQIATYIRATMPDARVTAFDTTGTRDHWRVQVISEAFRARNLLDCHRMVQKALAEPMADGRIHALELQTELPVGQVGR